MSCIHIWQRLKTAALSSALLVQSELPFTHLKCEKLINVRNKRERNETKKSRCCRCCCPCFCCCVVVVVVRLFNGSNGRRPTAPPQSNAQLTPPPPLLLNPPLLQFLLSALSAILSLVFKHCVQSVSTSASLLVISWFKLRGRAFTFESEHNQEIGSRSGRGSGRRVRACKCKEERE